MENTLKKLEVGTEVYYTGDMANHDGFGEVTAVNPATKFTPVLYTVLLKAQHSNFNCECDGEYVSGYCVPERTFQVYGTNFEGPGRRFMTKAKYDKNRAEKLADMRERYLEHQERMEAK